MNNQTLQKIQPLLSAQRKASPLTPHIKSLQEILYSSFQNFIPVISNNRPIPYNPNIYNFGRDELLKGAIKELPINVKHNQIGLQSDWWIWRFMANHKPPTGNQMFRMFVDAMGSQEQKKEYLEKIENYEVAGTYAQTELGHGSDIKSLETTATYDPKSKQFTLNSPTLTSTKYWPGEMGLLTNHAIVFAKFIINGQSMGVMPFIVRTKDDNYGNLVGIESGDIGPKIGLNGKQNGWMRFDNVKLPKNSLCNKYIQMGDQGQIRMVGDPKVGYGTMMRIRERISCFSPKLYTVGIIMTLRYSLFRKQTPTSKPLISLQTYQSQLFPRIAEYYAISIASNKIIKTCIQNKQKIIQNDFSLMKQTHSTLSWSKGYFSQIVFDGLQICKRFMDGSIGNSIYAGIGVVQEVNAPQITWEGDNTVLGLQTSNYILKSYEKVMKGKSGVRIGESVQYLLEVEEIMAIKTAQDVSPQTLSTIILQSLCHLLKQIIALLSIPTKNTKKQTLNYTLGLKMKKLYLLHSFHYTLQSFISQITKIQNILLKNSLNDLCLLFGINQLQKYADIAIKGGYLSNKMLSMYQNEKREVLGRLRNVVVSLVDGFGIPEEYLRSELVYGNPYENFLEKARRSSLNGQINESARLTKNIEQVYAKL